MNFPLIKHLGMQPYLQVWEKMREITLKKDEFIQDEIWIVEHPAVFTQGKAGKEEHILERSEIPVIWSDRGGQVTYHGPGQIVVYLLLNLHRLNLGIRQLVTALEKSIIQVLTSFSIQGHTLSHAPGVYVNQSKICSIGLRVRKGFTYHGLAFNFHMDLTPFSCINPCGYQDMKVTQLYDLIPKEKPSQKSVEDKILFFLMNELGYTV